MISLTTIPLNGYHGWATLDCGSMYPAWSLITLTTNGLCTCCKQNIVLNKKCTQAHTLSHTDVHNDNIDCANIQH